MIDFIFLVGLIVTTLGLIPMIRAGIRPPLSTSIPMTFALGLFSVGFFMTGLWFSFLLETVQALCWAYLAYRKWKA